MTVTEINEPRCRHCQGPVEDLDLEREAGGGRHGLVRQRVRAGG